MQLNDILNLILVAAGNAVLIRHEHLGVKGLEDIIGLSLDPSSSADARVVFEIDGQDVDWNGWVDYLQKAGAVSLGLTQISAASPLPESVRAAFEGTSDLVLVVRWSDRRDMWQSSIHRPRHPDPQGLRAPHRRGDPILYRYRRSGTIPGASAESQTVQASAALLGNALKNVAAYAKKQELPEWSDYFREASLLLTTPAPKESQVLEPLLERLGMPQESIRLVAAAVRSSEAFGGMGTWNDVPCAQEPEYENLSSLLLQIIKNSYLAAAETFG